MLPEEHRRELRAIIAEEIRNLEQSLEGLREGAKPVAPDNAIGRLTRMDSIVHQSTAEHVMNDSMRRLGQLKDRLKKIDSPSYGLCSKCRLPIAIERLKAAPEAVFCIGCAEEMSRKRR
jgi:DnaK suppressor protein